ncbi:MAG TPA: TolC family protein [Candidatus Brocadiia bacterium]|nr:TolC family protein [Candidatus Brocadiia bacterium]
MTVTKRNRALRSAQAWRASRAVALAVLSAIVFCAAAAAQDNGDDAMGKLREVLREKGSRGRVMVLKRNRDKVITLDRKTAIAVALENNLDVKSAYIDSHVAALDVIRASSLFDPAMLISAGNVKTIRPGFMKDEAFGGTGTQGSTYYFFQAGGGVQKMWPTSTLTTVEFAFASTLYEKSQLLIVNPWKESSLTLRAVQPLLKGAGPFYVNSPKLLAQKSADVANHMLRAKTATTIKDATVAYWTLVGEIAALDVAWVSRDRAEELLGVVQQTYRAGAIGAGELAQAEAELALREMEIGAQELVVLDAEDKLKQVLNISEVNEILSTAAVEPSDSPVFKPLDIDLSGLEKAAISGRPELMAAALQVEQARLLVKRMERENLPQLDLNVALGVLGGGSNEGHIIDAWGSGDYYQFVTSLSLTFPLGMRKERAQLRQARTRHVQAKLGSTSALRLIAQQVRYSANNAKMYERRISTVRALVDDRTKALADERIRFKEGQATTLDVLIAQEKLAYTEREMIKAHISFANAVAELDYAAGKLVRDMSLNADESTETGQRKE